VPDYVPGPEPGLLLLALAGLGLVLRRWNDQA
jgi:MYXO-CTERM domain-containing protein